MHGSSVTLLLTTGTKKANSKTATTVWKERPSDRPTCLRAIIFSRAPVGARPSDEVSLPADPPPSSAAPLLARSSTAEACPALMATTSGVSLHGKQTPMQQWRVYTAGDRNVGSKTNKKAKKTYHVGEGVFSVRRAVPTQFLITVYRLYSNKI